MQNNDSFGGAPGSGPGEAPPDRGVKDEVKNLASEAREQTSWIAGQAKEQAKGAVARRKDEVAEQIGALAGALRQTSQSLSGGEQPALGRYAGSAADQADRMARYLRERDLTTVVRDTETFARRHPDLFLGAAFLGGMLAARFLKSSSAPREATGGFSPEGGI